MTVPASVAAASPDELTGDAVDRDRQVWDAFVAELGPLADQIRDLESQLVKALPCIGRTLP